MNVPSIFAVFKGKTALFKGRLDKSTSAHKIIAFAAEVMSPANPVRAIGSVKQAEKFVASHPQQVKVLVVCKIESPHIVWTQLANTFSGTYLDGRSLALAFLSEN